MSATSRKYFAFLIVYLGILSAFGPFVIDMYLPALPEMTRVFDCDAMQMQLGLTFCMVGLAAGQLLFGPASDNYGRRPILIYTLMIFIAATVVCCLSDSIEIFLAARFLQGIGGAGGIVLSRSIATDLFSGRELDKTITTLSAINNIAPVVAPVVGGAVAQVWGWKGIFVLLLALGVALAFLCVPLKESLEKSKRISGNFAHSLKGYAMALGVKGFGRYCLLYALAMASLFAYISSTSFIVQGIFGLSTLEFSLVFAINAIALAIGSSLSIRFRTMSLAATTGTLVGAAISLTALLVVAFYTCDLILYELFTVALLISVGLIMTSSTAAAMARGRESAGAASALIGGIGFVAGGLVSPLIGNGDILLQSFVLCFIFLALGSILTYGRHREA